MKEKLIKKIKMENNQELEIYDFSRKIAEDTYFIGMIFRIIIKINYDYSDYKNMIDKLGEEVVYEVKHERNFIKTENKDDVFNEVMESFLNTNLKYLSHGKFAENYILKKYRNIL